MTGDGALQRIAADVKLGRDVKILGYVNLYGCEFGDQTKIGCFVEIQMSARMGARCKISSHTFICDGVTIEDEVFVGHNVTFINDRYPKATSPDGRPQTESIGLVSRRLSGAVHRLVRVPLCSVELPSGRTSSSERGVWSQATYPSKRSWPKIPSGK